VNIRQIDSLDFPELEPYRTLRRPQTHIARGIFVAEGEKVVRRLLDSGLQVLSILLTQAWLEELHSLYALSNMDIFVADKKLLESIVGYPLHQGIMAVARVPQEPELDHLLNALPDPLFLVALDGIVSAENVGIIVRNAVAFGAQAILAGMNSSSPYLRRAVRNSMGAVFRVAVVHTNLIHALNRIGKRCLRVAATPNAERSIHEVKLSGGVCLVLGNEGDGVSKHVLDTCDLHVAIPMRNETDSLNVASAAAVFLYEIANNRLPAGP
jgi:tRNA G18 (ribose-2'-O)-methylase SpoU